ncbi:serine hydrolase [Ochrobactrum sp. CM-21-5]|nr:serine hydrolase [Ochrobactrum sp. CM-21-5]MBC2887163.1 serine hydrolase [Ochrobactrum sp. CM-21-5]
MTAFTRTNNSSNPHAPVFPREEWDRAPWNRWTFQHVRSLLPTAQVWRGSGLATPLPANTRDIDDIEFETDGRRGSVARFIETNYVDGLLVLHRGMVVTERYLNGMTTRTPHLSQSIAKSVVGTVAGILISRGDLDPHAPITHYLPELQTTAYCGARIQHVLDMTSGTVFDETYTAPDSHMAKVDAAAGWKSRKASDWPTNVWDFILTLTEAECAHGTSFRYRSVETDILAFVLQRLTGTSLAELVSRELWVPMGAEEDAYFTVDPAGYALADGGFNATLRDYARFALLHLGRGMINGNRILSETWFHDICAGAEPDLFTGVYRDVLPRGAYHNQFWIEDRERGTYMARGVFGQLIYIDPEAEFGAVILSSWPEFVSSQRTRTTIAALHAIRDALSH